LQRKGGERKRGISDNSSVKKEVRGTAFKGRKLPSSVSKRENRKKKGQGEKKKKERIRTQYNLSADKRGGKRTRSSGSPTKKQACKKKTGPLPEKRAELAQGGGREFEKGKTLRGWTLTPREKGEKDSRTREGG